LGGDDGDKGVDEKIDLIGELKPVDKYPLVEVVFFFDGDVRWMGLLERGAEEEVVRVGEEDDGLDRLEGDCHGP